MSQWFCYLTGLYITPCGPMPGSIPLNWVPSCTHIQRPLNVLYFTVWAIQALKYRFWKMHLLPKYWIIYLYLTNPRRSRHQKNISLFPSFYSKRLKNACVMWRFWKTTYFVGFLWMKCANQKQQYPTNEGVALYKTYNSSYILISVCRFMRNMDHYRCDHGKLYALKTKTLRLHMGI